MDGLRVKMKFSSSDNIYELRNLFPYETLVLYGNNSEEYAEMDEIEFLDPKNIVDACFKLSIEEMLKDKYIPIFTILNHVNHDWELASISASGKINISNAKYYEDFARKLCELCVHPHIVINRSKSDHVKILMYYGKALYGESYVPTQDFKYYNSCVEFKKLLKQAHSLLK